MKIGILTSHPIQYQAPWFRALAQQCDLTVYFAHKPNAHEQGQGFGRAFTWDVDLLSGYKSEFLPNVAQRPNTGSYSGCDTPAIADRIEYEKFTAFIVSGWNLKCFWQAIKACRKSKIPVLVRGDSQLATPRSKLKALLKEFVYRRMLKSFDGFLTVGQRNRQYLRHYGVPAHKIFPAPHFVDNELFAHRAAENWSQRDTIRRDWGATPETLVVLFVGKFLPKKRPADILQAWAGLEAALRAKVTVVYLGSGELEGALRAEATALGAAPVFVGFKNQSELPACYAAANVLVLPSDGGETWGLVVNEAMACGIPAIVSEACGCNPDLIETGLTGFSFKTGDIATLTKAIADFAELHEAGQNWLPTLKQKLLQYNLQTCTTGTINAVEALSQKHCASDFVA